MYEKREETKVAEFVNVINLGRGHYEFFVFLLVFP